MTPRPRFRRVQGKLRDLKLQSTYVHCPPPSSTPAPCPVSDLRIRGSDAAYMLQIKLTELETTNSHQVVVISFHKIQLMHSRIDLCWSLISKTCREDQVLFLLVFVGDASVF
jgi:hypothetical protein